MTKTTRKLNITARLVMLLFYTFIAFCVPYCHDDWDWGLDVGIAQWLHATLNSRYAGNFFVVIMTRSELIKTAVISLTMFSIPLLLCKVCDRQHSLDKYLFANALMLMIPRFMWQQTFGWVSAFANFVVPAALTLCLILVMERSIYRRPGLYWLCLPLAVAEGLFSENLTIYAFAAFLIFTAAAAIKTKRINTFHIAMTLASAAGCVIMFSSGIYDVLLAEGRALGGIRELAVDPSSGFAGIVSQICGRFFTTIFPGLFFDYPVVIAGASLALIFSALRRRPGAFTVIVSVLTVALNICACLGTADEILRRSVPLMLFLCLLTLILLARRNVGKLLFFLLSAPVVLLPLAVTTELGPRLYFIPYIFMLAIAVCAMPPLTEGDRIATAVAALGLSLCMVFYAHIYVEIRSVTAARSEAIETAVKNGDRQVIIKKDVYEYWWGRNCGEERMAFFKEFYGIPENIEVIFEK